MNLHGQHTHTPPGQQRQRAAAAEAASLPFFIRAERLVVGMGKDGQQGFSGPLIELSFVR